MDKPAVVFVLPASVIGGAETKVFDLLRSLHSFERVLITQSSLVNFYADLGIKTYVFDAFHCTHPHVLTPRNIFAYARAIRTITEREKPDILLGIMHYGALFVTVAHDLFFLRAKPVVTIEGNLSAYFKSINRPPTVKESLLMKYCFIRAKGIIVPSDGVRADLIQNYSAGEEKVRTIYNGVDLERVKKASHNKILYQKDCPWIVTACRLDPQKDFATLLQAFRIIRDTTQAKLFIIGEGVLKDDIMRLSSELKVSEDVIMPGFQENPFPYISKADVFVLSSFYEGFGNVIVEAMALGVPVVSTDCPSGPREIVRDGEDGFLVSVGDAQGMAARCLLMLHDQRARERISYYGLQRAEDFSIQAMGKGFEEYLMRQTRD
jgi:glycosyltransferase involved in cell wall biosynthesis